MTATEFFGQPFGTISVDDILHVKRFEIARLREHVTDWEQLVHEELERSRDARLIFHPRLR